MVKNGRQIYELVAPFGRWKLGVVMLVALVQGILQVVGVTSILPFLAMAAKPEDFMQSRVGQEILRIWPGMTQKELLLSAGLFAIAMLAASNLVLLLGEVVRARYVRGLGHWLKTGLLARMMSNPYHYFLNHNTGELLKKSTGDVMTFITGILAPLMDLLARLLTVVLLLLALLLISPGLTLVAGFGLGIYYALAYSLLAPMRKRISNRLKMVNRGAMKQAIQTLSGIKPLKVHNAELSFLSRYGAFTAEQARLSKWIPILTNAPRYLIEPPAFGGIVAIVLYYVSTNQPLDAVLPSLGVMALAAYRMLPNIQLMYGAFSGISLNFHALEEIQDELKQISVNEQESRFVKKSVIDPLKWSESIELRNVTFRYQEADRAVLSDINLTIPKNSFVALIGETGSGKSTLIDLILGLHWPQTGEIRVDDRLLTRKNIRSWRAGVGYVPQEIFLTDDTIEANIAFGMSPGEIDRERVREVARAAQLEEFIEGELPNGYQTETGERGVRLSGGQKQRIGLARALYHNPSLLILDEATSALDNKTEEALMQAINELYGRLTIIAIAHRLTTIRNADRVVALKNGHLDRMGTFDEVVALKGGET